MKKIQKSLVLCSCLISYLFLTSFHSVDDAIWSKAYDQNNIVIYTRTTESGIKEFKAITTVNAKMTSILGVMMDYKTHPEWLQAIQKSQLVEKVSSKSHYIYYTIDLPWPLWNRDFISKNTFYKKSDGSVLMKMESKPKKKAVTKDHVRMKVADGYWKVSPISKTKTKVIYQYKADPNGLPAYVTNLFLLEAPKSTFQGLKRQVKLSKYKNPNLNWLYKK